MTRREVAGRASLLVVGLAVGLVGAEIALRVVQGARYAERPTFYPQHEVLGWAPAPNLDHTYYGGDYSIHVQTDERGRRLGALPPPAASDRLVVLLGDSYAFGWGVSTEDTFASQLDELLAPHGLRVVNLGVGGYGTTQSAERLRLELADAIPGSVEAVLVLHSHNDPIDNVTFAAVREGLLEYVESRRNSGVHLHNLLRFVQRGLAGGGQQASTLPGGYRDFLWTVGPEPTELGLRVLGGASGVPGAEYLDSAHGVEATYARGSLTPLQVDLLVESITEFGRLASSAGAPVFHTVIHTAPDWYLDAIVPLVDPDDGTEHWCGPIDTSSHVGPDENDHSGGHFTPSLNLLYARQASEWLTAGSCR